MKTTGQTASSERVRHSAIDCKASLAIVKTDSLVIVILYASGAPDEMVLSLTAKGLTSGEIVAHLTCGRTWAATAGCNCPDGPGDRHGHRADLRPDLLDPVAVAHVAARARTPAADPPGLGRETHVHLGIQGSLRQMLADSGSSRPLLINCSPPRGTFSAAGAANS
jgi:hypothetical protein